MLARGEGIWLGLTETLCVLVEAAEEAAKVGAKGPAVMQFPVVHLNVLDAGAARTRWSGMGGQVRSQQMESPHPMVYGRLHWLPMCFAHAQLPHVLQNYEIFKLIRSECPRFALALWAILRQFSRAIADCNGVSPLRASISERLVSKGGNSLSSALERSLTSSTMPEVESRKIRCRIC